ncbi:NADH-quinone oxidoreductase subunit NuoG [Legionella sp. W05-934-2]|uniref:NADH-quinone oxidoreductase subunit NuoG n=1 Tax=Legionella sp. W05-934-2 TaxID=1198649 RepID=UPI003462E243
MATIEIDGKKIDVDNGKMIIEVADEAGIYIPRFCYHKKLSVAANCRMCLVEVENGRKPVPACATPITDGMKVFTKSEEAIRSQKAVMEFLLINHPLDCPICDQGGECELQDISMGFGYDASEYEESKRSFDDDNIGPLISTEMTRCIHCTRCVRFGDEVGGLRELGATGRGETTHIGTYIKHSMESEVSGNVIDLCPVGALTSKPYRFTGRAWEMTQHDSIAPHDCIGSHIHLHVRRGRLMRAVPREYEPINETWLSDRDRFSYLGLTAPTRASKPQIKKGGEWQTTDWETALKFAAEGISHIIKKHGPEQFAAFASPSSTVEEGYLLQKLMRSLGVTNIDYRLHQTDFADQEHRPVLAGNNLAYQAIEEQENIVMIGCNITREVPLAGVRVRKAVQSGAKVAHLNPVDYDFHFTTSVSLVSAPQELPFDLAKILIGCVDGEIEKLPEAMKPLLIGLTPDDNHRKIAAMLSAEKAVMLTGALFENHPQASLLRTLSTLIQKHSGAKYLHFSTGANSTGLSLAGMLPHRGPAGKREESVGLDVQAALSANLAGYFLMNTEPGFDFENPGLARKAVLGAQFVVLLSAYSEESMKDYADVILPMAPYAETSGTYINIDNSWQSFKGALQPYEEARPAWKILRVMGNLLQCPGFDFVSSDEILQELKSHTQLMAIEEYPLYLPNAILEPNAAIQRVGEWPLYRGDAIVRRAEALQRCAAAESSCIRINPKTADRLHLGESATVSQGDIEITLPLKRDHRIALDVVWLPNAMQETADLGHSFAEINIKRETGK